MTPHTHELVIIRPADGAAVRWDTFESREAADEVRIRLVRIGMYAIVRRLADPSTVPEVTR